MESLHDEAPEGRALLLMVGVGADSMGLAVEGLEGFQFMTAGTQEVPTGSYLSRAGTDLA